MHDNEFRTGRVLHDAIAAVWPNLGRWLALSALVQSPLIIYQLTGRDPRLPEGQLGWLISVAINVGFYVLAQAAVTAAMLAHLRGQKVRVGALLSMAWRPAPLLPFVLALGLMNGLLTLVPAWYGAGYTRGLHYAIELGYDALLYFFVAVAVPVLVNERTGALEALKRNVHLTARHRGSLFGIYALLAVARWLTLFPVLVWAGITDSMGGMEGLRMWWMAGTVLGPVVWGAVNTSLYRVLRLVREGVDIASTPSVPDARIHASD